MPPRKMPAPKPIPQDLVTRTEMPDLFGVKLATIDQWRARAKNSDRPFPDPDDYIGPTPVWWLNRLQAWADLTNHPIDVEPMLTKRRAGVYSQARVRGPAASVAAHKTSPRNYKTATK